MLGTHQVIIIKEAQSLKWKSEEEILAQYLENPTPTTIKSLIGKRFGNLVVKERKFSNLFKRMA